MSLLTKAYFVRNKSTAFFGASLGLAGAAFIHFFPVSACAVPIGMAFLNFPYAAKGPIRRMLRVGLIGLYVSLWLMYGSKWVWPLGVLGLIGSTIFATGVICLRYCPPAAEPSHMAG